MTLTLLPMEGGKPGRSIQLKITGTTKITMVSTREMAGKLVAVQREADARDLQANQVIAVTYVMLKDGPVLLTAVVQAADKK